MQKQENLHLVYKELGETPLESLEKWRMNNPKYKNTPITYAGRLDPMAEGLLLLLSDEETKNKEFYTRLPKTYEVEILWGFETDTLDALGLVIQNTNIKELVDGTTLDDALAIFSVKFTQKYPMYSSKTVEGKPLWQWAREEKHPQSFPEREVEIFSATHLKRKEVSGKVLLEEIVSKVSKVNGDFRQKEIMSRWKTELSESMDKYFYIDKVELRVSSGFYVRQFVSDLATRLGTTAIALHIKRIRVGEFGLADL